MRPEDEARLVLAQSIFKQIRAGFCPCGYMGTIQNGTCWKCGTEWGIGPTQPDNWTHDRPATEGWYWVEESHGECTSIIHLTKRDGKMMYINYSRNWVDIADKEMIYCGPLQKPPYPWEKK